MANKNGTAGKAKTWKEKYEALRTAHKRLRVEIAKVEAEREMYLKSLHVLTRKPFSFSKKELRQMRSNPLGIEDVLRELQQEVDQHG
jgi:hypothetical protein